MQPTLKPVPGDQKRERDRKRDQDNPPVPNPAGDTNTSRKPGTRGAGEAANPKMMFSVDNDACTEKTDAGEDSLNDPAGGVGYFRGVAGWVSQHHDHCRGKTHQTKRLQADRFAVKIAIKTDQTARERGDAKAKHNLRPIQQCDDLQLPGRQR